ncbi:MAG TPA: 3-oxoacyl-[acyl-carrier-protein] reductase [Clostridia bacterium]
MLLKDKAAVVTGGTRGIGRAIVLELARNGADIAFNFNKSVEESQSLLAEIHGMGRKALAFQADVRDYQGMKNMIDQAKKEFGHLDILVNNAGITRDKALAMMGEEDWKDVIDTNLTGVYNCSKAVIIPFMKQQSGNIINITSVSGMIGLARQANYSAAKAGIIGFTKALAKEVSMYNIKVNAVAPGGIETDMLDVLTDKYKQDMLKNVPMGKFGTVEDVAKTVLFLLTDAAQYITGHVIPVDGGMAI